LADENLKKFQEKVKSFGNRGEIWNRGESASLPQGGWTPLFWCTI